MITSEQGKSQAVGTARDRTRKPEGPDWKNVRRGGGRAGRPGEDFSTAVLGWTVARGKGRLACRRPSRAVRQASEPGPVGVSYTCEGGCMGYFQRLEIIDGNPSGLIAECRNVSST